MRSLIERNRFATLQIPKDICGVNLVRKNATREQPQVSCLHFGSSAVAPLRSTVLWVSIRTAAPDILRLPRHLISTGSATQQSSPIPNSSGNFSNNCSIPTTLPLTPILSRPPAYDCQILATRRLHINNIRVITWLTTSPSS